VLFSTESGCRYGDSCRFTHGAGDAAVPTDKLGDGVDRYGAGMADVAVGGVEAAMASMSVADSSQPVTAADNSSSAGASACPSTTTLHSASHTAAAAAAKCGRKKKRTAKKGVRKMKQESKSKELVLYDHQTVKCGTLVELHDCPMITCCSSRLHVHNVIETV